MCFCVSARFSSKILMLSITFDVLLFPSEPGHQPEWPAEGERVGCANDRDQGRQSNIGPHNPHITSPSPHNTHHTVDQQHKIESVVSVVWGNVGYFPSDLSMFPCDPFVINTRVSSSTIVITCQIQDLICVRYIVTRYDIIIFCVLVLPSWCGKVQHIV